MDLLRKVTRYHLPSSFKACNNIALVTKSELSALIQKRTEVSEKVSTETTVIASFNAIKAAFCEELQIYILLPLVTLKRSLAISEKPQMNLQ